VFAHAMRDVLARIIPLPADIEAASHPEGAIARAKALHEG
jgi:hypothetical protein